MPLGNAEHRRSLPAHPNVHPPTDRAAPGFARRAPPARPGVAVWALFLDFVLVLSRFAGAARRADGTIIVNLYDVQGVADALRTALDLSLEERKTRWRALIEGARRNDVTAWRESFLERLCAVR